MESLQSESKKRVNEKDEWNAEKSALRVEETEHSISFSLSANSTRSQHHSLSESNNKQSATRVSQRGELKSFKEHVEDTNSRRLDAAAALDRHSLHSSATVTLQLEEDNEEDIEGGDDKDGGEDKEEDKAALSSSEVNLVQIKENFHNFISSNKLNEQMAEIIRNILITRPENVFLYAADCFRLKVG
jgi:hypothetical protein